MRIVVPRDARDHGYLALKVDGGGIRTRRRSGAAGPRVGWRGSWFGLARELVRWWCSRLTGSGAAVAGLLGLLVLGGMLVLQLVFGRVVFRGRRPVSGGLLLVGQPVLGGLGDLGVSGVRSSLAGCSSWSGTPGWS